MTVSASEEISIKLTFSSLYPPRTIIQLLSFNIPKETLVVGFHHVSMEGFRTQIHETHSNCTCLPETHHRRPTPRKPALARPENQSHNNELLVNLAVA